jgi:hypothetical protein
MKRINFIQLTLSLILFLITTITFAQTTIKDSLKSIKTIGIFDGKKVTVGNFETETVYKINEYCIYPQDISQSLLDSLSGKKVLVTGKLKILIGRTFPAKTSTNGTIYEPYIEPDKKFITQPTFTILK